MTSKLLIFALGLASAPGLASAETGFLAPKTTTNGTSPSHAKHEPWIVHNEGKCGGEVCESTRDVTCTCVSFCDCTSFGPSGGIDCGKGREGCAHYVERRLYVNIDGSGNAFCDTNWVYDENGDQSSFNWIYYWAPGHFGSEEVQVALYGTKEKGGDAHMGDYCTGWPLGDNHYATTNNDGKGWYLGGSYYVHSLRADAAYQKFNDGSLYDNGMFGLRVVLWPHRDLSPYNEVTCLKGNAASEAVKVVPDVDADFTESHCVAGNCSQLISKCVSPITRTYCLNLNDKWGLGVWDDLALSPFSFDPSASGSVSIKSSYPMLSAIADRYADTFVVDQGPGAGRFCNAGKAWLNPKPGTCVMTRFYSVPCHKAKWSFRSRAADDGASKFVLGCGSNEKGDIRCGDEAGQGWASYVNAWPTTWVQCIYTRVVDEQDGDCAARLRR